MYAFLTRNINIYVLTLRERKGCFLCSPVAISTKTNSKSKSFSMRQATTLMVAVEMGLPWTLIVIISRIYDRLLQVDEMKLYKGVYI